MNTSKTSGTITFKKNKKPLEMVLTFSQYNFDKCSKKRKIVILSQLIKLVSQELEKIN